MGCILENVDCQQICMGGETVSGTVAVSRHLELLHWGPLLALGHQLDLSSNSCEQLRFSTHRRTENGAQAGKLRGVAADSGSTSRSVSSLGTTAAVTASHCAVQQYRTPAKCAVRSLCEMHGGSTNGSCGAAHKPYKGTNIPRVAAYKSCRILSRKSYKPYKLQYASRTNRTKRSTASRTNFLYDLSLYCPSPLPLNGDSELRCRDLVSKTT